MVLTVAVTDGARGAGGGAAYHIAQRTVCCTSHEAHHRCGCFRCSLCSSPGTLHTSVNALNDLDALTFAAAMPSMPSVVVVDGRLDILVLFIKL